jgi:hypothetical protein
MSAQKYSMPATAQSTWIKAVAGILLLADIWQT